MSWWRALIFRHTAFDAMRFPDNKSYLHHSVSIGWCFRGWTWFFSAASGGFLVGGLEQFFSPYIGNNHPSWWATIFFRGLANSTTHQILPGSDQNFQSQALYFFLWLTWDPCLKPILWCVGLLTDPANLARGFGRVRYCPETFDDESRGRLCVWSQGPFFFVVVVIIIIL